MTETVEWAILCTDGRVHGCIDRDEVRCRRIFNDTRSLIDAITGWHPLCGGGPHVIGSRIVTNWQPGVPS